MIKVDSHKELLSQLDNKDFKYIIIDHNLVHNLGLEFIKETIKTHNHNNYDIILHLKSLPYIVFAIELKFPLILYQEKVGLVGIRKLGIENNSKIFSSINQINKYFAKKM